MKKSEVDVILATTNQDDWIVDDETGSYTYKEDLCLRIERASFDEYDDFYEDWARNHPDQNAKSVNYTVYYNNSFVDRKMLVSVDGHRATLPLPQSRTQLVVSPADVNFAKIVDIGGRVEEYLQRSGIIVI